MTTDVLSPDSYNQILYICRNMRYDDYKEIFCTTDATSPEEFAMQILSLVRAGILHGHIASLDDEPVSIIGVSRMWGGVVNVWMFATNKFNLIKIALTKFVKRIFIPIFVKEARITRAQCFSMVGHTAAHSWLRVLGAESEGVAKGYGKNGEDFTLFSWRF